MQAVRARLRHWPRWAWTAFGVMLIIIGIPSLRSDLQTWAHWLTAPPWLSWLRSLPLDWTVEQGTWWIFAVAGLIIILASNLPALLRMVGKADWALRLGATELARGEVQVSPTRPEDEHEKSTDAPRQEAEDVVGDAQNFNPDDYMERYGVFWTVTWVPRRYAGL